MSTTERDMLTRRIRDAVDIVDLVSGYARLTRCGASFKGLCPFHEEKTPSFYVHPVRQFFKCHGCGVGGDVYQFIQLKEKVDFTEARRILAERAGIELSPQRGGGPGGPGKTDLVRANQWAQQVFRRYYLGAPGEQARAYVERRGITAAMAEAFGLGLAVDSFDALVRQAGQSRIDLRVLLAAGLIKESPRGGYYDTFRNRLMFPISDSTGRIIGFGGRTLGEDPAKYLNTPATALFDKSASLFGLDRAKEAIPAAGYAIVVEGYTDCIMAHQFGFSQTVATLGTALTPAHARLLRRYADRAVLLFDSDQAGQKAADRGLSVALLGGLDVSLARVPEGKDPCDYLLSGGRAGFENVLKAGVPALEFKWLQVAAAYQAGATGPSRRRAVEAFLNDLSGWLERGSLDPIQKGLLINQLSQLLSLPADELLRSLPGGSGSRARRTAESPSPAAAGERGLDSAPSAEQEAFRQIIEVLLNEPGHFGAVADSLDPALIHEPALSEVAAGLIAMLRGPDSFRLVELIGRFESPVFGRLITDLAERGERRGQYAETIQGAVERLRFCRAATETMMLADANRARGDTGSARPSAPGDEDDRLRALHARARELHYVTPSKDRRRLLD